MPYIPYSKEGDSPLEKLLGHHPKILKIWNQLLKTFYSHSSFDPLLQEEVRRAVAYQIGCACCMSHGCPTPDIQDPKIKVAAHFAKKMAQTHLSITQQDIDTVKVYFTDKEIAELCAFIGFGTGYARFGAALNVDASF